MERLENILSVGFKKGEADFGIRATITELSSKQIDEFRSMCMVAIGTAEDMYRRSREESTSKSIK